MKFLLLFIATFTLLFSNPYNDIINYKLPNGLEVYLLPNKKLKNVQIEVDVKVGMRAENKKNAGISHLLEHLIFRDQRVKYNDYYDYFKEKGALYVNGFTTNYNSKFIAVINHKKAYWITNEFYKMLFDKKITNKDLEIEREALQIEIGEPKWTDYLSFGFLDYLDDFIEKITPNNEYSLYLDDFKIDITKDRFKKIDMRYYRQNNKKFTLQDILNHYNNYYYPSNMILKIVGNFDAKKMQKLINNTFAKVPKKDGKTLKYPIYKDAILSHKPFIKNELPGILPNPKIALGYKYIDDNMTKFMIIDSYFAYFANRLNRELRNKKGSAYSVSGNSYTKHDAGLSYIDFTTTHNNFTKSLNIAKNWLFKESSGDISDNIIKSAILNSKKNYLFIANNTSTLMKIVNNQIYQKRYYQDYKNPYNILNNLTINEYKNTIKNTFKRDNLYMVIQKDYFLFPYEAVVVLILTITLFALIYPKYASKITRRDIMFKRSISNIFISILIILLSLFIADILNEWIKHFIIKIFDINLLKVKYFGTPIDYIFIAIDFLIFLMLYIFLFKSLFSWYYNKLIVTKDSIVLAGGKAKFIKFNEIDSLNISSWSLDKLKNIYGFSLLFFKKLLKITTKDGKIYYVRSKNAKELKEDLENFIYKNRV